MNPAGDDDDKYNEGDDKLLWAYITRDVKPLRNRDGKPAKKEPRAGKKPRTAKTYTEKPVVPGPAPRGREVDGRTDERLRRGRMKIDARLDLHGMTQARAQQQLVSFVLDAYGRGCRCLLVVTGKGGKPRNPQEEDWSTPVTGILRQRVPEWLELPPLQNIVLKVQTAQPQHGGSGALYVLLRRKRETI